MEKKSITQKQKRPFRRCSSKCVKKNADRCAYALTNLWSKELGGSQIIEAEIRANAARKSVIGKSRKRKPRRLCQIIQLKLDIKTKGGEERG